MNHLKHGGHNSEKLELLLSLTSIRSDDVKAAIKDYLIRGANLEISAELNCINTPNLKRALKRLNETAAAVERIKEIDLHVSGGAKTVSKVIWGVV